MIVTEIRQYRVDAETKEDALVKRRSGDGELVASQDVANHEGNPRLVPIDQWPIWARAMRQFSKPEDKGIGDVVARIIGAENSEAFKAFHLKVTGKPCGCTGRQAQWNLKFPLRSDATS